MGRSGEQAITLLAGKCNTVLIIFASEGRPNSRVLMVSASIPSPLVGSLYPETVDGNALTFSVPKIAEFVIAPVRELVVGEYRVVTRIADGGVALPEPLDVV